jgi:hypothetical protein
MRPDILSRLLLVMHIFWRQALPEGRLSGILSRLALLTSESVLGVKASCMA